MVSHHCRCHICADGERVAISWNFYEIAQMKGHPEKKYFRYCLTLGLIGYLMVIALPDLGARKSYAAQIPYRPAQSSAWPAGPTVSPQNAWQSAQSSTTARIRCSVCGAEQSAARTTCRCCGRTLDVRTPVAGGSKAWTRSANDGSFEAETKRSTTPSLAQIMPQSGIADGGSGLNRK